MITIDQYRQCIGTFCTNIPRILQRKQSYIGKRCKYNNGLMHKKDHPYSYVWFTILVSMLIATMFVFGHVMLNHSNRTRNDTTIFTPTKWTFEQRTIIISVSCQMKTNQTNTSIPSCLKLINMLLVIGGIETDPGPNWLKILHDMSKCRTFDQLDHIIGYIHLPEIPVFVGTTCQMQYSCDNIAQSYIPTDIMSHEQMWMAVRTTGDGSCFLNSLSRLVYGHEHNALELRVRLIIEGIQNRHLYLNDAYLSRGIPHILDLSKRYCMYSSSFIDNVQYSQLIIAQTYLNELLNLTKQSAWCGIWQFHQAANMLKCKIYSVYPKLALNIRNDLHRNILPATYNDDVQQIHVMWTPSLPNSNVVNHFVPLVR
jgi:hypothetical protein